MLYRNERTTNLEEMKLSITAFIRLEAAIVVPTCCSFPLTTFPFLFSVYRKDKRSDEGNWILRQGTDSIYYAEDRKQLKSFICAENIRQKRMHHSQVL
ncbi:hypothetical protein TNIN_288451 [Trichonephila inaurata madagascariensis]|uniref:Uncharacterized protein n=1 Tax=Trichonephila inaurata madagascariensis TaxID=2747483 RepID=A0A8X6X6T3_9ARAC|nr:hypothetical protein TNIN_288451 [Trichonephila inaurata madagascariensis]